MTDRKLEILVSVLLRTGVLIAGAVVLAGGLYLIVQDGGRRADFANFRGEPPVNRLLHEITVSAFHGSAPSIIQFGMLLLIATPILRVALSLAGFALERDRAYVLITAAVLAILLYSLITGAITG